MPSEERKYPRYPCHLKINLTKDDGNSWDLSTLDVSVEGMRLLSKHKSLTLEPSSLVTIQLQKQQKLEPLLFSGVVRHYSIEQNGDTIFGVHITPLGDESKTHWHGVIEKVRLEGKEAPYTPR